MGTKPGRVQIEETGLPLTELPVEVTVWAASNPDEDPGPLADIRRQLADRFDLTVNMARPTRADVVTRILADSRPGGSPSAESAAVSASDHAAGPLTEAALRLDAIRWPTALLETVADVYVDFGLESLRAVEAMQQAASLRCVLSGRDEVALDDLIGVAPLVLRHRVDLGLLARITAYLQGLSGRPKSPAGSATASPGGQGQPDLTTADRAPRSGGQPATLKPDPSPLPWAQEAYRNAARSQQPNGATGQRASGAAGATVGPVAAQSAGAPQAAPPERGGLGRLLARFLSGGPTAEPASTNPASHSPGANSVDGSPGTSGAGSRTASAPPRVTAPPNRARSLFEISADHVVNLPEDAPRP
jgi:magnesium chelatase subunit I